MDETAALPLYLTELARTGQFAAGRIGCFDPQSRAVVEVDAQTATRPTATRRRARSSCAARMGRCSSSCCFEGTELLGLPPARTADRGRGASRPETWTRLRAVPRSPRPARGPLSCVRTLQARAPSTAAVVLAAPRVARLPCPCLVHATIRSTDAARPAAPLAVRRVARRLQEPRAAPRGGRPRGLRAGPLAPRPAGAGRGSPFTIEPDPDRLDQRIRRGEVNDLGTLDLVDCLEIAAANSREYQTQKETLYLSALDLTLERWRFALQKGGALGRGARTAATARPSAPAGVGALQPEQAARHGRARSWGTSASTSAARCSRSDGWHATSDIGLSVTQPLLRRRGREHRRGAADAGRARPRVLGARVRALPAHVRARRGDALLPAAADGRPGAQPGRERAQPGALDRAQPRARGGRATVRHRARPGPAERAALAERPARRRRRGSIGSSTSSRSSSGCR